MLALVSIKEYESKEHSKMIKINRLKEVRIRIKSVRDSTYYNITFYGKNNLRILLLMSAENRVFIFIPRMGSAGGAVLVVNINSGM